jgi:hypothetical protein
VQALRAQGLSSEAEDLCRMWVRSVTQAQAQLLGYEEAESFREISLSNSSNEHTRLDGRKTTTPQDYNHVQML